MKPRARRNTHHRRTALRAILIDMPARGHAASLQCFAATVLGYGHETVPQRIRRLAGKVTKKESTMRANGVQCASFGTDAIALLDKESIDF
jgi:hypothetical protein